LQALRLKMRHCKLFAAEIRILSGRGSAWLERLVRDQEVGGSNPLAPTIYPIPAKQLQPLWKRTPNSHFGPFGPVEPLVLLPRVCKLR
jgi:hypothetical protein